MCQSDKVMKVREQWRERYVLERKGVEAWTASWHVSCRFRVGLIQKVRQSEQNDNEECLPAKLIWPGIATISRSGKVSLRRVSSWMSYCSAKPGGSFPPFFDSATCLATPSMILADCVGLAVERGKKANEVIPTRNKPLPSALENG